MINRVSTRIDLKLEDDIYEYEEMVNTKLNDQNPFAEQCEIEINLDNNPFTEFTKTELKLLPMSMNNNIDSNIFQKTVKTNSPVNFKLNTNKQN